LATYIFFLLILNWFNKLVYKKNNQVKNQGDLMEKVNAFEAKTRLSELLRETEKGRSFMICRRGKEVAQLLPPASTRAGEGIQSISAGFRKIRGKISGPVNIRELIEEGRRF
jgi:antitoxin (DNA-binding transcriptional repressor) of toxin-antitoxin stability system